MTFKRLPRFTPERLAALEQHSEKEELVHSILHGIGAALAAAGLALLVTLAGLQGDVWKVVSFSVYGATLVLLYLTSTFYHGVRSPRLKRLFRIFDHAAIYLLIAGTYTPFMLVPLRGVWGWSLFGVTWGLAVFGVVTTALFIDRLGLLHVLSYVAMGWIIVFALRPLAEALPIGGIVWLAAGGVAYTLGVVFYATKRIPYNHAVWHVFVLGGSICHFFAMLLYVLPM